MADSPGTQTPPKDPKSQDKTGPVRPPVLEGSARSATEAKPAPSGMEAKPTPAAAGKAEPPKSSSPAKPAAPGPAPTSPWLAGLVGGALGLGAAYGLAWFGLWPAQPQAPQPADPRLAQFSTAIPELQGTTGTLRSDLTALGNRISGLETDIAAIPVPAAAADNDSLAEDLAALTARVEALASAPAAAADTSQADSNAQAIAALEAQLAAFRQAAGATETQLADLEGQVTALAQAASAASESQAARLPLIFSGLESAFAAGRGFETELGALRQALPSIVVPEALAAAAANGLPRPDDVARQLDAAIPDMLAGRPVDADADWQDGALDWVRGVIALRPTGDIEGDGIDAQIARLEASVARHDFIAAKAALAALPAPMQAAAGNVAAGITSLADAQAFLAQLRDAALRAESGA